MKSRFLFLAVSLLTVLSMLLTACGADSTPTALPAPAATNTTAAAPAATNTTGTTTEATATTGTTTQATATTGGTTAATPTEAAAGGGTTPTAVAGGGGAATPSTAPAAATNTPKPGEKIFRFNQGTEPDTTDPQKMSFVGEIGWGSLAFEGLYDLNEKSEVVPAMANGMPQVSADGLQYTVTLKDGMKYSDGTPLTAKNFEYAFRRLFDPSVTGREYASVAYDIKGSQELSEFTDITDTAKLKSLQDGLGVKALDDKHIQFTVNSPVAYFPYILAIWVGWPTREDMVQKGGESWTEPSTYVGNGPYVLTQWNHGNGAIWEANPNWFRGAPKVGRIEMRMIVESAVSFQAYKSGELDLVGVAAEDLKEATSAPLGTEHVRTPGNCNFYIGFNTKKAPFDNMKVRQAFSYAFDRADYVEVVLKGQGAEARSFVPPGRPGNYTDIDQPDFDSTKGQQLLTDAGFANGAGLPPIKLTFSNTARNRQRFQWIQDQLKTNLGINAELDPVESTAYTALVKQDATTPQMFFLGWCQDYPDPQDWYSLVFRSDSTVTHVGWKNAQFDTLTKQADTEKDATKRMDLYHQAAKILNQETPVVYIYWDVYDYLIKPYVSGVKEHISTADRAFPGDRNIENIDITK